MAKFGEGKEGGKVPKIEFPHGGDGHMFSKGTAGRAESGCSGKESNSPGGGSDEWAKGGSGHMFGKGHAGKKVPGVSGKETQEG